MNLKDKYQSAYPIYSPRFELRKHPLQTLNMSTNCVDRFYFKILKNTKM
jgi:hypothetical protein